jgi:hypothetical protein
LSNPLDRLADHVREGDLVAAAFVFHAFAPRTPFLSPTSRQTP